MQLLIMAKQYSEANPYCCYFQIYKIWEKKTTNIILNGLWIWTTIQVFCQESIVMEHKHYFQIVYVTAWDVYAMFYYCTR